MMRLLSAEGIPVIGANNAGDSERIPLDITRREAVEELIKTLQPSAVIHLAGKTYLPWVFAHQKESFQANVLGTANILEAVRLHAPSARVLLTSSCTVYGDPEATDLPLKESAPLRALHPYGVQKIGMEVLGQQFAADYGLDVIIARPFNHVGPGMSTRISAAHFARMIADHERGFTSNQLRVGNLNAQRDFLDVRDVVRAYLSLLRAESPPAVVNVASGTAVRIADILGDLIRLSGRKFEVELDSSRLRPLDTPLLLGDASLLKRSVGFARHIPWEQTLTDILSEARLSSEGRGL
jgi:GDP-4-dehydro-6-deoxy-D-mannose reductase